MMPQEVSRREMSIQPRSLHRSVVLFFLMIGWAEVHAQVSPSGPSVTPPAAVEIEEPEDVDEALQDVREAAEPDTAARTRPSDESPNGEPLRSETPAGEIVDPIPPVGSVSAPVVRYRGVPLEEAWRDLAAKAGVVAVLDPSLPADVRQQRIRLETRHLDAEQALRWLGRVAGLEVIEREGVYWAGPAHAAPHAWQIASASPAQDGLADARRQRAEIDWLDSPLSRVKRDVSEHFAIDLIYAPAILTDQPLISGTLNSAGLDDVLALVEDKLNAQAVFADAACWMQPREAPWPRWLRRASNLAGERSGIRPGERATPRASTMIRVDRGVSSWRELTEGIQRQGGRVRWDLSANPVYPEPAAHGTLEEILVAAQMLGRLSCDRTKAGDQGVVWSVRILPEH